MKMFGPNFTKAYLYTYRKMLRNSKHTRKRNGANSHQIVQTSLCTALTRVPLACISSARQYRQTKTTTKAARTATLHRTATKKNEIAETL